MAPFFTSDDRWPLLFGHMHSRRDNSRFPTGRSIDVGVDYWDYRPATWAELKAEMARLADAPATSRGC